MTKRILSISGLRGVIGEGLDPVYVSQFAAALGTLTHGGTIVVSRDGRSSGQVVKHAVISALMATGCRVLDAGISTTPTCGVLITEFNADGGLQITASHNPVQWNGLKPFSNEGSVLNEQQGKAFLDVFNRQEFAWKTWDHLGSLEVLTEPAAPHLERVLRLVDVQRIRERKFKVVLDCNHGSGAVAGPRLLEELGCEVVVLGETPDGMFEHIPEPVKENLGGLCDAVIRECADVGFAQDPDADRLAIVDNTGTYIGEELTLALGVEYVFSRTPGPVVVNGSTSRVTADIAERYGCPFHRSAVGEAHVCAKMKEVSAVIGGEGNGGVIEPKVGYVRDSFVSMAYVLAGLMERNCTLSEWVAQLPQYAIIKDKLECPQERVDLACTALRSAYSDAKVSEGDGLRLDWPDRWVQVRASNTEPILRVIAEAPDDKTSRKLCREAMQTVREAVRD